MDYLFSILTALLAFITPCVLPMLPVFVSYFSAGESSKRRTFINALGFALGLVFVLVAFGVVISIISANAGRFITNYRWLINLITGLIVMVLGLSFVGVINIPFLNSTRSIKVKTDKLKFFSAVVVGMVYALSFGACTVGFQTFTLLSVIETAIDTGNIFKAVMVQATYSITLGALFVICAMLIDYLKGIFGFIKRHYNIVNLVSGLILIILGILMATGVMARITGVI